MIYRLNYSSTRHKFTTIPQNLNSPLLKKTFYPEKQFSNKFSFSTTLSDRTLNLADINITTPSFLRSLASLSVGLLSKLFLKCSRVHLLNFDILLNHVKNRNSTESLITYQNHASTLDDPLLWGTLPAHFLANPKLVRWSLAAKEVIFLNPVFNAFFAAGQTIPIVRGAGIYQPGMDASLKLLNEGGWINIYPEGKVNRNSPLLPFKWGIGRLVQETKTNPIIIPIYHSGMVGCFPGNGDYIPRIGKDIIFSIGKPIDVRNVLSNDPQYIEIRKNSSSLEVERSYITKILQDNLEILRQDTLNWMKNNNLKPVFCES